MRLLQMIFLVIATSVGLLLAGCGGGDYTPPHEGAPTSSPYFNISTQALSVGGTAETWGNVAISGYANQYEIPCDVATDTNCIPEIFGQHNPNGIIYENGISSFNTDSYGQANFFTDAQPASWTFFGDGTKASSNDSLCTTFFAQYTTLLGQSTGLTVPLQCGAIAETLVASPNTCGIIWVLSPTTNQYVEENTCPSSVTLTVPATLASTNPIPTNTSLLQADVTNTGANVEQSTISTASNTSVTVPVPTTQGTTYIVVVNPQTNTLLGMAPFTYFVQAQPNQGCHAKKCN